MTYNIVFSCVFVQLKRVTTPLLFRACVVGTLYVRSDDNGRPETCLYICYRQQKAIRFFFCHDGRSSRTSRRVQIIMVIRLQGADS